MADVVISYATQDRDRAEQFADALTQSGLSVWFDAGLPSRSTVASTIKAEILRAKCVLVLWSKHSVRSMWVCDQANIGRERGLLVPVFIDNLDVHVDLPLEFHHIRHF